jgi:hypothetical protein
MRDECAMNEAIARAALSLTETCVALSEGFTQGVKDSHVSAELKARNAKGGSPTTVGTWRRTGDVIRLGGDNVPSASDIRNAINQAALAGAGTKVIDEVIKGKKMARTAYEAIRSLGRVKPAEGSEGETEETDGLEEVKTDAHYLSALIATLDKGIALDRTPEGLDMLKAIHGRVSAALYGEAVVAEAEAALALAV